MGLQNGALVETKDSEIGGNWRDRTVENNAGGSPTDVGF